MTATTHDPTVQTVTDDLAALGDTPNAVADALLKAGRCGNPECDATCPVACHLAATYPGWTVLVEDAGGLWARLSREGDDYTENVEVELPAAVAEFVIRLIWGEYAELDERVNLAALR